MAEDGNDPLERWLRQQAEPLPPPPGTFELIVRRARRRKVRRAVLAVASAAAAAAIAVPLSTTLHLTTATGADLASGGGTARQPTRSSPAAPGAVTQSPEGQGSVSGNASLAPASAAAGGGYLPPNFRPTSVTWVSASTGWILGPAGTPGQCDNSNPDICTSLARTGDGGRTWHGLPAPDTAGVTGVRFLNATYGWAFGPELWSTENGGESWQQVNTGGLTVTDLEAIGGRAYALFAVCTAPSGGTMPSVTDCSSYTLETSVPGSGSWTPVSGVPAALSSGSAAAAADIEISGPTAYTPATVYLIAPDGTLYSGPAAGGTWHRVSAVPCAPSLVPGAVLPDGKPQDVLLAPVGASPSGGALLGLVCSRPQGSGEYATVTYLSRDGGATWTRQSAAGTAGGAFPGQPRSLTATTVGGGTLVLATSSGIYLLSPGAAQWRQAAGTGAAAGQEGFSYVGMTSPEQGVAIAAGQAEIWMTTDGGQTWQARPIIS